MKTATYKIGQTVKTPHGNGKIIGATPHRLAPEEEPSVWMYGVEFVPPVDQIPSNQMPFIEAELDGWNVE